MKLKSKDILSAHRFHFVGVGGIGMSGLAELLKNMGAQVSGSDLHANTNTEHLEGIGVKIFVGHHADNVQGCDVVVYSSAVKETNPEIQAARKNNVPIIPRAEALAEIMRLRRGVAVAGTHGKTTTTSMVASIFLAAKLDPTIAVGGRFDLIKSTALLGKGDWMIAEADESDGSFHKLSPEISIVTNIDYDHLDFYSSFENLQASFLEFAERVPFFGICVGCGDDTIVRHVLKSYSKPLVYYGFKENNDYVVSGGNGTYSMSFEKKKLGEFKLHVPGKHNALNATAAIIAALHAGIDFETCSQGLENFKGVDRRFQFKGEEKGILIYDDYGHHPTEVRATLAGFKEKFPQRRLVVLFQPHRYSRTKLCWQDFVHCFEDCDVLLLTDIYPAGEAPVEGVTSEILAKEISKPKTVYIKKSAELSIHVQKQINGGDIFLTLGAGDVWKVGAEILSALRSSYP